MPEEANIETTPAMPAPVPVAKRKSSPAKKTAKTQTLARATGQTQICISLPESLVKQIDRMADKARRNRSSFIACSMQDLCDALAKQ